MQTQTQFARLGLILCGAFFSSVALIGQNPRQYTAEDYQRANQFDNAHTLLLHEVSDPHWLPDGRFWYSDQGEKGTTFFVIDPVTGQKQKAFNHTKLAAALTAFYGANRKPGTPAPKAVDADHLPVSDFALADKGREVTLTADDVQLTCDLSGTPGVCNRYTAAPLPPTTLQPVSTDEAVSPDGRNAVFIREWNLFLRNRSTGKETQLTTDGVPDFGYATDNNGWRHSDSPVLVWSPDSRRIATYQLDQRNVGELYLTDVKPARPTLTTLRYAFAGDKNVPMIERVVINLPASEESGGQAAVVRLQMPQDQHRPTLSVDPDGELEHDMQWGDDSRTLAFASVSRDQKQVWVRIADPDTGAVREVMSETSPTVFQSGVDRVNWHYVSASNELLWYSERSGWGHLYLYDTYTGKLKHQITTGDWNVAELLDVDEKQRTLAFLGRGKENGEDPYYAMYYSVDFDGQNLRLLTPERADHTITPSPDHGYFVDAYSTPVEPQKAVLRESSGKVVAEVARADTSKLQAIGWRPPIPVKVKAHDGKTDLYGLMFRPAHFSEKKRYPIIDNVYPGPQATSCDTRSMSAGHSGLQALAELGFVVVCIDGMGTPYRSQAFRDAYSLEYNTIPDQVAGIKELAQRYPSIDLARVGIYGHSGGGKATAEAMFAFPDFFKVGVAESGDYDDRFYTDGWAEMWLALKTTRPDGTSNYDSQAKEPIAKNLKGHLLLAQGSGDDNVPMLNTMLLVDALVKANKDFDLLILPNARHSYGADARYMTRRRWDYFVRYLAEGIPPFEYKMKKP